MNEDTNSGTSDSAPDERTNAAIWTGHAATYDTVRPAPPAMLLDMLTQLAEVSRPRLVVDVGSGTGLSTRAWLGRADEVIGIEPNAEMRAIAETYAARGQPGETAPASDTQLRYLDGTSSATGLPAGQADIVTISQALHWMEPEPTFAEVARLLRPGGVFAAYDYDWPPLILPETELAYERIMRHALALLGGWVTQPGVRMWDKREHLERMRASGQFRIAREIVLGSVLHGGAEDLIGLILSDRLGREVMQKAANEDEAGITEFRRAMRAALGDSIYPWYVGYRVRLAVC